MVNETGDEIEQAIMPRTDKIGSTPRWVVSKWKLRSFLSSSVHERSDTPDAIYDMKNLDVVNQGTNQGANQLEPTQHQQQQQQQQQL
ncbi:hypothetical protein M0802_010863 [Mischocyttarus mexicanus]|nr:hypothetical protein M0802_010863 [Mischocyttarus mexicanus]